MTDTTSTSNDDNTLTVEKLERMWKTLKDMKPRAETAPSRVVFTPSALKDSEERTFPTSRHRSARIRKKLIRRHGGEFRRVPAMWTAGDTIFAHPSYEAEFKRQLKEKTDSAMENALLFGDRPTPSLFGDRPMFGLSPFSLTGN